MKRYKKILYAHCIFVSGYLRDCLYDLHFEEKHFFPNGTGTLFYLGDFENNVTDDDNEIVKYLEENDLIFEVDLEHVDYYPLMNLQWDYYSDITNIEIAVSDFIIKNIELIREIVHLTKCYHLKIRYNGSIGDLKELIKKFDFEEIKSIDLYLGNNENEEEIIKIKDEILVLGNVYHTQHFLGNIKSYMMINTSLFTESQNHNTYFNRKLYIGAIGEIKNSVECDKIFGNIDELENLEDIKNIIKSEDFKEYWFVHKGHCDVCKDCELRHMCVDNRIPFQRSKNEWYHKRECNYNPYISKWQGEEDYVSLAECGVISNETEFSIDHERIAEINERLWG